MVGFFEIYAICNLYFQIFIFFGYTYVVSCISPCVNGICLDPGPGACRCNPGWRGASCSEGNLETVQYTSCGIVTSLMSIWWMIKTIIHAYL